jgi:hypothetical protein
MAEGQEIIPPARFAIPRARNRESLDSLTGFSFQYRATTDSSSLPQMAVQDFVLARQALQKATDFRQRAFASPSLLNLIG